MAVNAVAPFEGTLEWVGDVNSGSSQNGEWKSVDFAIKYVDHNMNEKLITFNAFGEDKVTKILSYPMGTFLKVVWWPDTNQNRSTGKCFPKNSAISFGLGQHEVKSADTKITAPSFPEQKTQTPKSESWKNPYKEIPQPDVELPEDDMPF